MGTFQVTIGVGNLNGGDTAEVTAWVDTGADHTTIPASLLERTHIVPDEYEVFELANGETVELRVSDARIFYEGRSRVCPVVFGEGSDSLLGATTLEIFGLLADPKGKALTRRTYRGRYI
jgi:predicted aspartyl protease